MISIGIMHSDLDRDSELKTKRKREWLHSGSQLTNEEANPKLTRLETRAEG